MFPVTPVLTTLPQTQTPQLFPERKQAPNTRLLPHLVVTCHYGICSLLSTCHLPASYVIFQVHEAVSLSTRLQFCNSWAWNLQLNMPLLYSRSAFTHLVTQELPWLKAPPSFSDTLWEVPLRGPGRWQPTRRSCRDPSSALMGAEDTALSWLDSKQNHQVPVHTALAHSPLTPKEFSLVDAASPAEEMPKEFPEWGHRPGLPKQPLGLWWPNTFSLYKVIFIGQVRGLSTPETANDYELKFPTFSHFPGISLPSCPIPQFRFSRGVLCSSLLQAPVA